MEKYTQSRLKRFWDWLVNASPFFTVLLMTFGVVYGWMSLADFKRDLAFRARPYVNFFPDTAKTMTLGVSVSDPNQWSIQVDYLLSNGSGVAVKNTRQGHLDARIGKGDRFCEEECDWKKAYDYISDANDDEVVNIVSGLSDCLLNPKIEPLTYTVTFQLTEMQVEKLHKSSVSAEPDCSLYFYCPILYENALGEEYESLYFWEIYPVLRGLLSSKDKDMSGIQPLHPDPNSLIDLGKLKRTPEQLAFGIVHGLILSDSKERN